MIPPGRILFLGLVLALAAPALARESGEAQVVELLSRPLESPAHAAELTSELAALGSPGIPALFLALAAGEIEDAQGAKVQLDGPRVAALLGALVVLSPTSVRAHLASFDRAELDDRVRRAGLVVYGAIGKGDNLRAMVSLAAPLDPAALLEAPVRGAFREALSAVFARDKAASSHVRGAFEVAQPCLRALLIEGVRNAAPVEGLHVLGLLLGSDAELDLLTLTAIGHLARTSSDQIDPALLQRVREYLSRGDERLVQASVIALGRLRDPRAVQDLIELLDSPNANLRASADQALRDTAGRDFRGNRERWQDWYGAEQAWWADAEVRLMKEFRSQHAAQLARALNEVSEHRLFRRELELVLMEELRAKDPLLQAMACSALGRLGSRAALGELKALTAQRDPRVVAAAREACLRILGEPQRHQPGG